MSAKWKLGIPVLMGFLIAAYFIGQGSDSIYVDEPQELIVETDQDIKDHPGWNESPREPIVGESTVEIPFTDETEKSKEYNIK
ncbi:hypothetical protein ACFSCZ_00675 [Siminovitchia sediminis]|uniref:Secreted protein n=1 Tax=Siminovitchia sediminis TaxID=1274353 RepID=A0ABW4KBR9_9BACI